MRNTWAGTRGLSTQTSSSTGQMRGEQQSSAGGLRHWGGTRRCGRDLGALPRILTWGVAGSVAEPPGGSRVAHDVFISYSHLSLIHISEPTRLGMISYAVFC